VGKQIAGENMKLALLLALVALGMGGCASNDYAAQPVNITADSFCQIVDEKLTWEVRDTPPTIQGIRRLNAKWDSKCGLGKPVS
jgi:hypothetical protein